MNKENFSETLKTDEDTQEIDLVMGRDGFLKGDLSEEPRSEMYPSSYEITKDQLPQGMDNIDFVMAFAKVLDPNFNLTKEAVKRRLDTQGNLPEIGALFFVGISKDGTVILKNIEDSSDTSANILLKEVIELTNSGNNFGAGKNWSERYKEITRS